MNKMLAFAVMLTAVDPVFAEVPEGWSFHNPSGDYRVESDAQVARVGRPGVSIRPESKKPFVPNRGCFGILYQTFSAENYRGKRVRFSAFATAMDIDQYADVWMRVDKKNGSPDWFDSPSGKPLGFDRADFGGAFGWKKVELVLDVPKNAETITFGYSLYGNGGIWANGLSFEGVGADVAVTDHQKPLSEPKNTF